jgi:hypothetical protein
MLGELFAIYLLGNEKEGGEREIEIEKETRFFISVFSFPCRTRPMPQTVEC